MLHIPAFAVNMHSFIYAFYPLNNYENKLLKFFYLCLLQPQEPELVMSTLNLSKFTPRPNL